MTSAFAAFVSYAKADQGKAHEIATSLEERGFKCWIAPRDVRPGRSYGDEIIRGIESANCLILVLSSASNGSAFVSREIERAVSKNKPIFTVRIEDVQPAPALELFISSTQWIDAFSGRLGPHIDRLARFLAEDEGGGPSEPSGRAALASPRPPTRWLGPAALAAALLAGLGGVLFWNFRGQEAEGRPPQSADEPAAQASTGLQDGFFGPDTRRALNEFSPQEREKLAASYAYVGTLIDGGAALCNATLVAKNLILTSNYCFQGRDPAGIVFRILDREGRPLESKITNTMVSEPLRGVSAGQRVAVATLAEPLGDQVGWVKTVGGEPAIGDRLDIVAVDLRPGSHDPINFRIAGASTNDPNCVVLARAAGTDSFAHRCISPIGSGGAPIFEANTGALVGIVGETDTQNWIALAYRTGAVPGLIRQAASQ